MAKRKEVSVRVLRRLIDYDPDTGEMRWKERPVWMFSNVHYGRLTLSRMWNDRYAGEVAFTAAGPRGYKRGRIFDRGYLAHRVIWALHYGDWPSNEIDHINGVPSDNRIINLRDVPGSENMKNLAVSKANTSGAFGVYWCKKDRAWVASIRANGKSTYIKQSKDKRVAVAARRAAERKYGYHPNHGREK